jgi:hypothetical protein
VTLRLNRHHIRILKDCATSRFFSDGRVVGDREPYTSRHERYRNQLVAKGHLYCYRFPQTRGPFAVEVFNLTDTGRGALTRAGWSFARPPFRPLRRTLDGAMRGYHNRQQALQA